MNETNKNWEIEFDNEIFGLSRENCDLHAHQITVESALEEINKLIK